VDASAWNRVYRLAINTAVATAAGVEVGQAVRVA
jgi:hypothetical protein